MRKMLLICVAALCLVAVWPSESQAAVRSRAVVVNPHRGFGFGFGFNRFAFGFSRFSFGYNAFAFNRFAYAPRVVFAAPVYQAPVAFAAPCQVSYGFNAFAAPVAYGGFGAGFYGAGGCNRAAFRFGY